MKQWLPKQRHHRPCSPDIGRDQSMRTGVANNGALKPCAPPLLHNIHQAISAHVPLLHLTPATHTQLMGVSAVGRSHVVFCVFLCQ
jgi:hypothetical protein